MIPEDDAWRVGYLPSFSINAEVGDVDNFADDLDELIDLLDDPGSSDEPVSDLLDRFNNTLVQMGESGYIKNSISISAPFFPLFHQSDVLGGAIGVELSVDAQIGLSILDAPLAYDNQNTSFSTSTSLYLKSGLATKIAVGYSREISLDRLDFLGDGVLYGGAKVSLISMELSKQIIPVQQLDGKDVDEVIKDEYDANLKTSTNVAIDVGVVWDAERYRAGFTIANINSPEFDYGTIGENCTAREDNTLTRSACEIATTFTQELGEIDATETHTMDAYARIDGALKLSERWILSSSLDLAEYNDVVGFDNQWFHMATSYQTKGYFLPSTRIGYQKNLAGSELSSVTFGFTFFKCIGLDFEWGLEEVTVDDETAPRRFGFALSFEESF